MELLNTKTAIKKSKDIWGDYYNYSLFEYFDSKTPVILSYSHLNVYVCKKCLTDKNSYCINNIKLVEIKYDESIEEKINFIYEKEKV
jgi:hypothetical protein